MKIINFLWKRLLMPSFAVYTLMSFTMVAFLTATSSSKPALELSSFIMLFTMALLISASSLVFFLDRISLAVRTVINFFLTLFSIIVVTLCTDYDIGKNSLIIVILFTVLYLFTAIPAVLVYAHFDKKKHEDKNYTGLFGN